MYGVVLCKCGVGYGYIGLFDVVFGQCYVIFECLQQVGVVYVVSCVVSDEVWCDFIVLGGGVGVGDCIYVVLDYEIVFCSELYLVFVCFDMVSIFYVVFGQQYVVIVVCCIGWFMGCDVGVLFYCYFVECIVECVVVGVGVVQVIVVELCIVDLCCSCQQIVDINLVVVVEYYFVVVGYEYCVVGFQLVQDLVGLCLWFVDVVQYCLVRVLQEVQCGVVVDVEGFLVQDCFVRGLFDCDLYLFVVVL